MTLSRKIAVSLYQYYKKKEAKQLLENANQLLCKKDLQHNKITLLSTPEKFILRYRTKDNNEDDMNYGNTNF